MLPENYLRSFLLSWSCELNIGRFDLKAEGKGLGKAGKATDEGLNWQITDKEKRRIVNDKEIWEEQESTGLHSWEKVILDFLIRIRSRFHEGSKNGVFKYYTRLGRVQMETKMYFHKEREKRIIKRKSFSFRFQCSRSFS